MSTMVWQMVLPQRPEDFEALLISDLLPETRELIFAGRRSASNVRRTCDQLVRRCSYTRTTIAATILAPVPSFPNTRYSSLRVEMICPFAAAANGQSPPGSPIRNGVTAAYFLLVHYRYLPLEVFVCPATDHQKDPLFAQGPQLAVQFRPHGPAGKRLLL